MAASPAFAPAGELVPLRREAGTLLALPALLLLLHFLLGDGYGFHRDELQFLSDARHLAWGFVAYPPLTSFCGRVAIALFGISPQVFRLPAALANGLTLLLVSLLARDLGGRRAAMLLSAAAVFPLALAFSTMMQYTTFDLLAWTVSVYFTARVLRTGDARNWVGVGVGVGLGVLSKYAIAFPVLSLLVALALMPSGRRHLRSRWFLTGALVAVAIAAPNLLWLFRHGFVTLRMEESIHARDVRLGRAAGYWTDQLRFTLLALPLVPAGLWWLLRRERFRLLSAFFLGPLVLFALAKGRGYYLLPAYPVVYAAAMVGLEERLRRATPRLRRLWRAAAGSAMLLNVLAVTLVYAPVFPVDSALWHWQVAHNEDLANEIGWETFVVQVARARHRVPREELPRLAILADNYGEAGALELYGPRYHLPAPISPVNSFWARGTGPYVPETYLIVGSRLEQEHNFEHCEVAGTVVWPFEIRNEETDEHPQILVCRGLRGSLPEIWGREQTFG